jgi:hypothetical protein
MDIILLENERKFKSKMFQEGLKEYDITNDCEIRAIINIYSKAKDLYIRNTCIKLLYNNNNKLLKDFFTNAYKKERYLDMKINILRGLLYHITEDEVKKLLDKFNETLKKRKETTPYNYQEYELLLGKNALPYLDRNYPYKCIRETLRIVEEQYNEMPDAFKGHFTVDDNGDYVQLRSPEETNKMITDFFEKNNK